MKNQSASFTTPRQALLWAGGWTALLIALTAGLALLLPNGDFWAGMTIAKSGMTDEYCELNRMDDLIRQQMNSWSNFAYLFLGLLTLKHAHSTAKPGMWIRSFRAYAYLVAFSFIFLWLGSFFFHASLTRIGQRLDMTATYGVVLTIILGLAYRLGENKIWPHTPSSQRILILLAGILYVTFYLVKWHLPATIVLPGMMGIVGLLGLILLLQRRAELNIFWYVGGAIFIFIAAVFRIWDLDKFVCGPESWFQWHSLWHVFTGMSGFAFYLFLGTGKKA